MRFVLLVLFVSSSLCSFGGDSTKTWKDIVKDFKPLELAPEYVRTDMNKKLISQIELLDYRLDKARLGMYSDNSHHPRQVVLKKQSLSGLIKQRLENEKSEGSKFLVVLQDFWMTELSPEILYDKNDRSAPEMRTTKLTCKAFIFLQQDGQYVALTSVDTTFWHAARIYPAAYRLLENFLETSQQKIEAELSGKEYSERKKMTKEFLAEYYSNKLAFRSMPAGIPPRGIYESFQSFKDASPLQGEFKIVQTKKEPSLLYSIDEKGNEILKPKVWGVCDGENMYIAQSGQLFKLTSRVTHGIGSG